ncbi:Hsp20/alpha crystallin family protein [Geodermatophilus obscurus]|uniref:Heat shock protein Hsp20 n=1 Tax=Geodermatophilus obscurus (strain ATCC 25078 / DSM 43160 / JCM 3152 / CCUG 61914 / KCC A-0152 / KCTC 9177 / NBRC 13315 / NRRL B-3577 / G-20) TaxID=526225 RepID=D2SAV3_GEOOG|nr:Hsp20/alpha crystallin family protein [Geodermatophilus obscurus]ADB75988.1 heat shock protein Hsp20 [Geodermatophilus obscurus DSM 43160]
MTLPVRSPSRSAARWDPLRELDELYERVNTLWQSGLSGALDQWSPLADVEETDDAYTVEIDLPGVAREDVDIQLDDRRLTVSGDIEEKERTGILHRRTRRVGRFHYSVTLPGDVDADGVSAQLHDGVLTVRVPKSAQAKPRRIPISS